MDSFMKKTTNLALLLGLQLGGFLRSTGNQFSWSKMSKKATYILVKMLNISKHDSLYAIALNELLCIYVIRFWG